MNVQQTYYTYIHNTHNIHIILYILYASLLYVQRYAFTLQFGKFCHTLNRTFTFKMTYYISVFPRLHKGFCP